MKRKFPKRPKLESANETYRRAKIAQATKVTGLAFTALIVYGLISRWTDASPDSSLVIAAGVLGFWLTMYIGVVAHHLEAAVTRAHRQAEERAAAVPPRQFTPDMFPDYD